MQSSEAGFVTSTAAASGTQHVGVIWLQMQSSDREAERPCSAASRSRRGRSGAADASAAAISWPTVRTSTQMAAILLPRAPAEAMAAVTDRDWS